MTMAQRRFARRRGTGEAGFTLIECMVAVAILTIAFLGVVGVAGLQGGVTSGATVGHSAVTRGYLQSQGVTLAQERLEQVKRLQYAIGPPAVDELASSPPAGFPDEAAVAGFPAFSRQVRVLNATPAPDMKTVTVTVTFNAPHGDRRVQESVVLRTLVARRP